MSENEALELWTRKEPHKSSHVLSFSTRDMMFYTQVGLARGVFEVGMVYLFSMMMGSFHDWKLTVQA